LIPFPRQEDGTYLTNTLNWAYDGMYRLTNEVSASTSSAGQYSTAYQYDLVGNRLKKLQISGSSTNSVESAFDLNDELLTEVMRLNGSLTGTNSYSYDSNGSLTGKTDNSGTITYAYNLANKLSSVTNGGSTTSYLYNDSGIRVSASTPGQNPSLYLVDANNHTGYAQVLEELNTLGGAATMSYVLGDDVLAQSSGSSASYLLYDGHGSTRQLVNGALGVTSKYNYDAYGVALDNCYNPTGTSLRYCGEQFDAALQMYNLRARYYNPGNGRFSQRDVFAGNNEDPQSLHKYAYCYGDPVNGVDPRGTWVTIDLLVTMAVISVLVATVVVPGTAAWFRGSAPQTTNSQVPASSDWSTISSLHHAAYIAGSSWNKERFFSYMTSLKQSLPKDIITADTDMSGIGQVVTFTLQSANAQLGQRPFKVRTVRYDTASLIAVAVTLDGHPLNGWRAWHVSEGGGKILLETWSVDEPANSRERLKYALGGETAQEQTWKGMLENIAVASEGTLEWVSDPLGDRSDRGDYQSLWNRMGVPANGE
jgi:RHS repeat-associated protein